MLKHLVRAPAWFLVGAALMLVWRDSPPPKYGHFLEAYVVQRHLSLGAAPRGIGRAAPQKIGCYRCIGKA